MSGRRVAGLNQTWCGTTPGLKHAGTSSLGRVITYPSALSEILKEIEYLSLTLIFNKPHTKIFYKLWDGLSSASLAALD